VPPLLSPSPEGCGSLKADSAENLCKFFFGAGAHAELIEVAIELEINGDPNLRKLKDWQEKENSPFPPTFASLSKRR
jgi:hypothetical protein